MLSSHSKIYIPPESDFIPRLFLRRGRVPMTERKALENIRVVLRNRRFFREWKGEPLDAETFVGGLSDMSPASFLHALYGAYAAQYGATRWGDKSPIYTNYVGLLTEIFPEAQFVHLIRDGRDAALSSLSAYRERFYVDLYFAARSWRSRVRASRKAGAALGPGRYLEIRFEELTAHPEQVLRSVCRFLGESYAPAMSEPHALGRELLRPTGRHAPVRHPVTPKSDRWRREMAPTDLRLFQEVAGDLLRDLGYETVELGTMSMREWIRRSRLATKYGVLEGGRRVLQTAGIFHPH
jgi:hypothetical protein